MKRILNVSLVAAASLLFTACTGSSAPAPVQSPSFKLGVQDGCATASGAYTKNSEAFKNDKDYHEGWFSGRKKCNPSQAQK
jgi:hypothetical protein